MIQFEKLINERECFVKEAIERYPELPLEKARKFTPRGLSINFYKRKLKYDEDRKDDNERNYFEEGSKKITEILRFLKSETAEIQFAEQNNIGTWRKFIIIFRYRKKDGKIERAEVSKIDNNPIISVLIFNAVLACLLSPDDFKAVLECLSSLNDSTEAIRDDKKAMKVFYDETEMTKKEYPEYFEKLIARMNILKSTNHFQSSKNGRTGTEEICSEIKSAYEWAKKNPEICKGGPLQFVNDIYRLNLKTDRYLKAKAKV